MASKQQRTKSDSYSVFVKALKNSEERQPQQAAAGDGAERILTSLAASGPMLVPELMERTELELAVFLERLESLRSLGLVTVRHEANRDILDLTDSGRAVAQRE